MTEPSRNYRDVLVEGHQKASQDFDKAIIALSGGALGVSLVFIRDVAPEPKCIVLLGFSWSLFAASLLLTLISFLTSQERILRRIADYDAGTTSVRGVQGITRLINWGSAVCLVGGVVFLVVFALYNLE